jgi:biotin carboxyl carrier protein
VCTDVQTLLVGIIVLARKGGTPSRVSRMQRRAMCIAGAMARRQVRVCVERVMVSAPRRGILTARGDVGRSSTRAAQRAGVAWTQRRAFSGEIMIAVPQMGDSITEGDLGTIFFKVGDTVNMDEVLAEIETDKVTSEVKAPTSGTITAILAEEGDTVTVNQELFTMAAGEGAPAVAPAVAAAAAPAPAAAAPAPPPAAAPAAAAAAPADSHGRSPMIQFRYGHNKLVAVAAAAAGGAASAYSGGGLLIDYKNHVDPQPAVLRAERRRGSAFTEEEIEAFNLGGWD